MESGFDTLIDRTATASLKWDGRKETFGRDDVTPLWVADMDFAAPPCVLQAISRRLAHGVFGYTRMPPGVAAAIASWMERRHGWSVRPEWVVPCPGVVFGLHVAVRAVSAAGAAVVAQPPVYFPFYRAVESAGSVLVRNALKLRAGRYEMDLADLDGRLQAGARVVMLCSPHNPGGRVWSRDELAGVLDVAARRDAVVVCDEIHADLAFAGSRHVPIGSLPGAGGRVITLSGPTKAFNFPGLPVGYAIVEGEGLRARFQHELRATAAPPPSVFALDALQAAYREGEGWLSDVLEYLDGNRAAIARFLGEHLPRSRPMQPEASYLSWIDFSAISLSESALNDRLVQEARVGLTRGSAFGPEGAGFMRLNFACPRSLLEQSLERIAQVLG